MKYQGKRIEGFGSIITIEGEVVNVKTGKVRRLRTTMSGYLDVALNNKGFKKWMLVHRLVAIAYIPNPENKPFVNHIDGDKQNNHVDNLEWVTHQENMEHAKNHNLVHRGERNFNSIHSVEQVETICKLLELGYRNTDIAESVGTRPHNVSLIRNKVCWQHISCKYNIPKRSRTHSPETILWISEKIKEGLTQSEILKLTDNKRINQYLIQDIKRGLYTDVTGIPIHRPCKTNK